MSILYYNFHSNLPYSYEGIHCEVCAPGYEGNPLIPGDSCRHKVADNCNPTGTKMIRPPDECVCKDNVQGRYCDQCKNDSFYLSSDFRYISLSNVEHTLRHFN